MTLDPIINKAIIDAALELNQSDELVRRLSAWIGALLDGNESLSDNDSRFRHLNLIYESTVQRNKLKINLGE